MSAAYIFFILMYIVKDKEDPDERFLKEEKCAYADRMNGSLMMTKHIRP